MPEPVAYNIAQVARLSHQEGQGFKSPRLHQKTSRLEAGGLVFPTQ